MTEEVQEAQTVEEEVVLQFRRFPAEKQDQVRALVNYATLMGLNGKDLVSIGGKLERVKAKRESDSNWTLVQSMNIRPIGRDKNCRERWAYTDALGIVYHFSMDFSRFVITNTKTKKFVRGYISNYYPIKRSPVQFNRDLPQVMLNVYYGTIKLP